jgi:hypothetical protein
MVMGNIHIDDLKSNDKWWFELGMLCREQYLLDNPEMGRLEAVAGPGQLHYSGGQRAVALLGWPEGSCTRSIVPAGERRTSRWQRWQRADVG